MKKTLALVLCAAMLLTVVAGCGDNSSTPGNNAELDRTLNMAINGDPSNLDIQMNTSGVAVVIALSSVYELLCGMDENYNVVYELAESCDISSDSTTYTYHLRKGVKFHNGQEMKAADVVASMNRWIDNASNANNLVGGAHFYQVDDYTVEIKMEKGTAYLNQMIAGLGQRAVIMPASVIEATPDGELVAEYIGTGPYQYAETKANQYIKLTKFDGYTPYGKEGDFSGYVGYKHQNYDEVYFYICSDVATISAGIQSGEYDLTESLSNDDYATFAGKSEYSITSGEGSMHMMIFNKKGPHGSDLKIRQAVQTLLNDDDIMYASFGNKEFYDLYSSYMYRSQKDWYTEAGSQYYNQGDAEKAKQMFADAGWTSGDTFRLLVANDDVEFYTEAQAVQQQMRAAGIECELLLYDWSTFVDIRNNQPDAYDAFITSFDPKVLPNMNLFLSASWAGWCDDAYVQGQLADLASDVDLEHAKKTWQDLQLHLYENYVPVVKFGVAKGYTVSTSKLTGVQDMENMVWVDTMLTK